MIYQPMGFQQAKAEGAEHARESGTETIVAILENGQFMWITKGQYLSDDAIHPSQQAWYSACGKTKNEALLAAAVAWLHNREDER